MQNGDINTLKMPKSLLANLHSRFKQKPNPADSISVQQFRRAIKKLPSDEPCIRPGIWYKTQKEHWLGWLKAYNGPGAYGRKGGKNRDARYAYNHIVEYRMLLWLIPAAGVDQGLVETAYEASKSSASLQGKSAAIRKIVPWEVVAEALWGDSNIPPQA